MSQRLEDGDEEDCVFRAILLSSLKPACVAMRPCLKTKFPPQTQASSSVKEEYCNYFKTNVSSVPETWQTLRNENSLPR